MKRTGKLKYTRTNILKSGTWGNENIEEAVATATALQLSKQPFSETNSQTNY